MDWKYRMSRLRDAVEGVLENESVPWQGRFAQEAFASIAKLGSDLGGNATSFVELCDTLAARNAENEEAHDSLLQLVGDLVNAMRSACRDIVGLETRLDIIEERLTTHMKTDRDVEGILAERVTRLEGRLSDTAASLERQRELLWPDDNHLTSVLGRLDAIEERLAGGRPPVWDQSKQVIEPELQMVTEWSIDTAEAPEAQPLLYKPVDYTGDPGDEHTFPGPEALADDWRGQFPGIAAGIDIVEATEKLRYIATGDGNFRQFGSEDAKAILALIDRLRTQNTPRELTLWQLRATLAHERVEQLTRLIPFITDGRWDAEDALEHMMDWKRDQ